MQNSLFSDMHPSVALAYGCIAMVLSMATMQPVMCAIAYAGVSIFGATLDGWRTSLRRLGWQLPVIAAVGALNCIFYQRGTTVLFEIGVWTLHLESMAFGLCMGMMFVTTLQLFMLLGEVVSGDDVLSMFGNLFPTCAIMVSVALGLVPRMQLDAKEISDVAAACTSAGEMPGQTSKRSFSDRVRLRANVVSTLMSNAMEDSLTKADSMRARGWGETGKRTLYRRHAIAVSDVASLGIVALFVVFAVIGAVACVSGFAFYPTISPSCEWWAYVAYASFFLLPAVECLRRRLRWMR